MAVEITVLFLSIVIIDFNGFIYTIFNIIIQTSCGEMTMIKKIILIGLATGTLTTSIIAAENHHTLTQQREKVITQYITDLQKAVVLK